MGISGDLGRKREQSASAQPATLVGADQLRKAQLRVLKSELEQAAAARVLCLGK
jgi:hypothetical protein